jgi:uncharacterized protein with beta-barrel porin domain
MADAAQRFISTRISNVGEHLSGLHGTAGPDLENGNGNRSNLRLALNGHALTSSSAIAHHRVGVWVDTTFGLGSHGGTASRGGLSSGETAIGAGVDLRISDRLVLGVAGGFARDGTALIAGGNQGTRASARDIAVYGSLRLGQSGFLDGMLGFGNLRFDTQRLDAITSSTATGSRTGSDAFASLTTGQRYERGKFSIEPYAGLTADLAHLKAFTESGAGIGTLTFGDQAIREVSAVAGVRADAHYATAVGVVTPRGSLEFGRRLSAIGTAPLWYADRPGVIFSAPANQSGTQPLTLGAGGTLRLPRGYLFNVDYRSIIDRAAVQHLLTLGVSAKF